MFGFGIFPIKYPHRKRKVSLRTLIISIMVRMFASGSRELGSISGSHTKDSKKWHLLPPCSTIGIIRYGSRVSGTITEKGVAPSPTP